MKREGRAVRRKSLGGIFAVPVCIAVASLVGLVAALLGEGWMNVVGWIGVGVPVAVTVLARLDIRGAPINGGH